MTRGVMTLTQARELISMNGNVVAALRKMAPHTFADAIRQRAAIRQEFERLIATQSARARR